MIRRVMGSLLLTACALAVSASARAADVEIGRRWATTAPVIDGVLTAGEWDGARVTPLPHGQLRTMNDASFLYVMLDVTGDNVNDPTSGPTAADYFVLAFDIDLNFAVTPHVDLFYDACTDSRTFIKAFYLGGNAFTGCQNTDPASQGQPGFGPSPAAGGNHRFFEFRLDLGEIGVDPSTWTTSSGGVPHVRMNVATISGNPPFSTGQPDPNIFPNLSNPMFQLDLATLPAFPPGTTGPTFFGVGLVPSSFIDSLGYANMNVPNYYQAVDAPFGGNLNVFGNWNLVFTGAARYRIVYSKDGGPSTPLLQTWTNFRFNSGTGNWDPVAFSPDVNGRYPFVNPFQIWYLPNLLASWQSASFPDGTYVLRLELFDSAGNPMAAPPGNSLTLFVDNTPPTPIINSISYNGANVCACAIVTQGSAPLGFTFNISYTDPHGALDGVSLGAIFGANQSTGSIFADSYASHIDEDGANRWNGETNVVVPVGPAFRAATSCAYSFLLDTSSRIQNGYTRLFSVRYTTSLTILLGSGSGSISSCSGGLLSGKLSMESLASHSASPTLRFRQAGPVSATDEQAPESGQPVGLP